MIADKPEESGNINDVGFQGEYNLSIATDQVKEGNYSIKADGDSSGFSGRDFSRNWGYTGSDVYIRTWVRIADLANMAGVSLVAVGSDSSWNFIGICFNPDGTARVNWQFGTGATSLLSVNAAEWFLLDAHFHAVGSAGPSTALIKVNGTTFIDYSEVIEVGAHDRIGVGQDYGTYHDDPGAVWFDSPQIDIVPIPAAEAPRVAFRLVVS